MLGRHRGITVAKRIYLPVLRWARFICFCARHKAFVRMFELPSADQLACRHAFAKHEAATNQVVLGHLLIDAKQDQPCSFGINASLGDSL